MKGKIVLIPFPFTDSASKFRPALVLSETKKEVIVVLISSKKDKAKPTDVTICAADPEFKQTGLTVDSVVKIDKIATLSKSLIAEIIGEVGPILKKEVNDKITETLNL